MQLALTYDELNSMILSRTGKKLTLSYVDRYTVRITYSIPILMTGKDVSVNLTVISLNGPDLLLAYDAGAMVNPLIKSVLPGIVSKAPSGLLTVGDNNNVMIHLDAAPQGAQMLGSITLKSIYFEPDRPVVEFSPRIF